MRPLYDNLQKNTFSMNCRAKVTLNAKTFIETFYVIYFYLFCNAYDNIISV